MRSQARRLGVLMAVAMLFIATPVAAQDRMLGPADIAAFTDVTEVEMSPDGRTVAIVSATASRRMPGVSRRPKRFVDADSGQRRGDPRV